MSPTIRSATRSQLVSVREILKNLARFAPTDLLETLSNYAVLKASRGLLPADLGGGVTRAAYVDAVHRQVSRGKPLLYMEFGVYRGKSMRAWAVRDENPRSRFVGFDSFVGLPQKWRRRPARYFNLNGALPDIDDSRVTFVKGWFNRTLPDWLDGHTIPGDATPVINIDADLYSSCSFILGSLHGRLSTYYVMFDEFGAGEARALRDYLAAYGAQFCPLMARSRRSFSRVPMQVFGEITTTPAC